MMKNKKGFTLIELIVVILILGVVAAVAVPKIVVAVDKAKEAKFANDIRSLMLASITAHVQDPTISKLKVGGSANNKKAAEAVAKIMGKEVYEIKPGAQKYMVSDIEIPGTVGETYVVLRTEGIYLRIYHIPWEEGKALARQMGYGEPTDKDVIPKNLNAFADGDSAGGKRHMLFALARFD